MIKHFCDACGAEVMAGGGHNIIYNGNLVVMLRVRDTSKWDDKDVCLCSKCYKEAIDAYFDDKGHNPG